MTNFTLYYTYISFIVFLFCLLYRQWS